LGRIDLYSDGFGVVNGRAMGWLPGLHFSLRFLCVLCVSAVEKWEPYLYRRDAETQSLRREFKLVHLVVKDCFILLFVISASLCFNERSHLEAISYV